MRTRRPYRCNVPSLRHGALAIFDPRTSPLAPSRTSCVLAQQLLSTTDWVGEKLSHSRSEESRGEPRHPSASASLQSLSRSGLPHRLTSADDREGLERTCRPSAVLDAGPLD